MPLPVLITTANNVQGCDASVLLSGGSKSEQLEVPNQTLRPEALKLIDDIRAALHSACGPKVSCADITTLATRDAVVASGGPYFDVPLGRRDGLAPASSDLVGTLPAPFFDVPTLIEAFKNRSLDTADLVALSGAHTVGRGHCASFSDRLPPNVDDTIDPAFREKLTAKCAKDPNGTVTQVLDVRTPSAFDNKYYFDLIAKQGLFKSDQGLIDHPATKRMATRFSLNQGAFFDQFARSMVKMSQMDVLTGNKGEIRRLNCAVPNARASASSSAAGLLLHTAEQDEGLAADA
ncbi:cationic peroxidase SPC4-like isoform X2 [Panicum miliaceum]|uniref:Peroxidase n=1 Tax=Panicum miliaceum TaxID=4540 RepID=A0A3L6Q8A7_PANMI|nr:cationic peroxidase SPC4-like isoform X2 [Panicum miliaceum]